MTISEIRTILSQDDVAEELLQEILSDERKGVKTLVGSYMKRLERKSRERLRVESMYDVESRFYQEGLTHIVGTTCRTGNGGGSHSPTTLVLCGAQ